MGTLLEVRSRMSFRFVMVPPNLRPEWPAAIRAAVPACEAEGYENLAEAWEAIVEADAAYGTLPPEYLARARKLKWLCAPQAGLGGAWFYPELVRHPVVVTNSRGIFNDHLSHHVLGLILAHSRHVPYYAELQAQRQWGPGLPIQHLPDCTLLIIGCGAAGQATARLAKCFGMTVLATDARETTAPEGVDELHPPDALLSLLPRADFVVMIVPETPQTKNMMSALQFQAMKPTAYLINVGRGKTLVLADLVSALEQKQLAGAALDVFEIEPLPPEHPLWGMKQVQLTPHVSGEGPYCWDRRLELIVANCRRFAAGESLLNVVDKQQWF